MESQNKMLEEVMYLWIWYGVPIIYIAIQTLIQIILKYTNISNVLIQIPVYIRINGEINGYIG